VSARELDAIPNLVLAPSLLTLPNSEPGPACSSFSNLALPKIVAP
jgi:hypothetical protein